jgi:hypothetical protein
MLCVGPTYHTLCSRCHTRPTCWVSSFTRPSCRPEQPRGASPHWPSGAAPPCHSATRRHKAERAPEQPPRPLFQQAHRRNSPRQCLIGAHHTVPISPAVYPHRPLRRTSYQARSRHPALHSGAKPRVDRLQPPCWLPRTQESNTRAVAIPRF